MKNTLFATLARKQRKTSFNASEEMSFFRHNGFLVDLTQSFGFLIHSDETFDIIRANILVRGILNKTAIESGYQEIAKALQGREGEEGYHELLKERMQDVMKDLPVLQKGGQSIYVPIFSEAINRIYAEEFEKLSLPPYNSLLSNYQSVIIDPFDTYGDDLYDSYFTNLVLVKKTAQGSAFYDYDADAIYFVNKQGRLDVKLALFDSKILRPNHNQMMKRIAGVVDAYYEGNEKELEEKLVENKLISSDLIHSINTKKQKHLDRIRKRNAK